MVSLVALIIMIVIACAISIAASQWMSSRSLKRHWPELLNTQFPDMARRVLKEMGEDFLQLAKRDLAAERQKNLSDLDLKRQAVENTVKGLQEQLKRHETLVNEFESDRDQKYGSLKGELERVIQGNDLLQRTTSNLIAVLGNSRVRGQWGQKMAEDILRFCGLHEGLHYRREQELSAGRPDYTFFLPDDHQLFMDVKFPLDNYVKFMGAREEEQRSAREAFTKDVREHIREMERRDYLAQSDRSVDYILIFIPNEHVYGLLNEWMPTLIDDCLRKKTILCGPWTLYATLRIIMQAWQNYQLSIAIHDIVKAINGFSSDYTKFKERFMELGDLLEKVDEKYREITTKSYQRLDQKIRKIEDYRKGQHIPEELPEPDPFPAGPLATARK